MKRMLAMLAVVVLVAAGCGDDDEDTAATATGGAGEGPVSLTVNVDADTDDPKAFHLGYFPGTVKARPGDTVVYKSNFTGEPHSITFGSFVTPAIDVFLNATPEQLAADEPPPEFEPLFKYSMLPEGPGDANQVSANPCFVAAGALPEDTTKPCAEREAAPFTGKEVFYNSGFLPDGEEFELELADDIAPGTYRGFCMLHLTEMISTIEVVAEGSEVPSADEVAEQADKELAAVTADAEEHKEKAEAATTDPATVLAGDAPEGEEEGPDGPPKPNTSVGLAEFTPEEVSVKSGSAVTFNINGPHSVTFNAPEDARTIIGKGPDGFVHLNEKAASPAKFNVPPPPEGEPEGPPPTVDLGSYDGTGFANTGIQFGGSFKVTFTKAGSYTFICVVHPEMEGVVKVT